MPDVAGTSQARIDVRKTYKLFIGGAFPRSESGRTFHVTSAKGYFLANAAQASRKDAREAVAAARTARYGWAGATSYNRGQVLYRIAEMLEGRRAQCATEVSAADGISYDAALEQVNLTVDRWVWYAGWTDKISAVLGSTNSVAGPYLNITTPEPVGVVAAIAPTSPSLLALVSVLAPIVAAGATCVCVVTGAAALPAMSFAEVLATSDLPEGVINLLTGFAPEIAPWLASHEDVDLLDLSGCDDPTLAIDLERAAAEHLARIVRPVGVAYDWSSDPGLSRIRPMVELKTVWHPMGI